MARPLERAIEVHRDDFVTGAVGKPAPKARIGVGPRSPTEDLRPTEAGRVLRTELVHGDLYILDRKLLGRFVPHFSAHTILQVRTPGRSVESDRGNLPVRSSRMPVEIDRTKRLCADAFESAVSSPLADPGSAKTDRNSAGNFRAALLVDLGREEPIEVLEHPLCGFLQKRTSGKVGVAPSRFLQKRTSGKVGVDPCRFLRSGTRGNLRLTFSRIGQSGPSEVPELTLCRFRESGPPGSLSVDPCRIGRGGPSEVTRHPPRRFGQSGPNELTFTLPRGSAETSPAPRRSRRRSRRRRGSSG